MTGDTEIINWPYRPSRRPSKPDHFGFTWFTGGRKPAKGRLTRLPI
jgi:hypothetical protein